MDVNYLNLLKNSWKGFQKNLVLLLPILISLLLFLGFLIVVVIEIIALVIVFSKSIFSDPIIILKSLEGVLFLVFFGIADLIFVWIISAYIRAMQIGMYADVAKKKRTTPDAMFKYGKQFFKIYFKYIVAKFVIFVLPVLILGFLVFVCYLASKILAVFVGVLAFLILLAYLTFVGFGLFFIEPIIATEKRGLLELIKQSFNYSINNFGHVIITWGIIVIVTLAIVFIMFFIQAPVGILIEVLKKTGLIAALVPLYLINILFNIIRGIVNAIMRVVLDIFVFSCYFAKKKRK